MPDPRRWETNLVNDTPKHEQGPADDGESAGRGGVDRRHALMLGAFAASTIVSVRPAIAQATGSVLNCEIPVPDRAQAGQYIAGDGRLVPPDTPGSFAPPGRNYTGEEVKRALQGRSLPGATYEQNQAYLNYIRRLQAGQSGFTCYASLQMPR